MTEDVDTLFPPDKGLSGGGRTPDVDELFPPSIGARREATQASSPIHDFLFGNEAAGVPTPFSRSGRLLNAFGQGAKQGWGTEPMGLSDETEQFLKKAGVFNDYANGRTSFIKSMNEALMRPSAVALDAAMRAGTSAFRGAQDVIAETGEMVGAPNLGRELAAVPEAFIGTPHPIGVPKRFAAPDIAEARSLGVIGAGEDGWKGTEPVAEPAEAPPTQEIPPDFHGLVVPVEVPRETPKAPPTGRPEVDAILDSPVTSKSIDQPIIDRTHDVPYGAGGSVPLEDPQVFIDRHFPTSMTSKEGVTFDPAEPFLIHENVEQHTMDILIKGGMTEGEAYRVAHFDYAEVAEGAWYRSRGIDQAAIEAQYKPILDQIQHEKPENPPPNLYKKPYPHDDVAMAQHGATEEARPSAEESAKARAIIEKWAAERSAKVGEPAAPAPAPAERSPAQQRAFITSDVMQKLMAAGRPADEAEAAAQLIASRYETRAALFKGALGTAQELYEREGAEIRGPGARQPPPAAPVAPAPASAPIPPLPPVPEGMARFYHGGADPTSGGGRWLTPDYQYARDYGEGGREVHYVDIPTDSPLLTKAFDDTGTDQKAPFISFEAPEEIAKQLKPVEPKPAEPPVSPPATSIQALDTALDAARAKVRDAFDELQRIKRTRAPPDEIAEARQKHTAALEEADAARKAELAQSSRGKITLRAGERPIITLMKDANASTFIHETGHQLLEEMMSDAEHADAPDILKADAKTVTDWLGIKEASKIKKRHHEKFAKAFEQYMREGVSPSPELAGVFAKFKNWLLSIYETIKGLGKPINDDIRGVFDRMLAAEPDRPASGQGFADLHEADAESTPHEQARPVAQTIQGERDRVAAVHAPEEQDARLQDLADGARRREAGNPQPDRDGNAPRPVGGEGEAPQEPGAVGAGRGETPDQGPRSPVVSRAGKPTEPPVGPNESFSPSESHLIDKAGNIRLDNLNTPEDINAVLREAANENGDFMDVRGVVPDAEVLALADAAGVDATKVDMAKFAEQFGRGGLASKIVALRKMLIQSATSVRDAMGLAADGTDKDVLAYAEVRTRHMMIQSTLSAVTAEAGRALRAFRFLSGQEEAGVISDFLKSQPEIGKTLFQLKEEAKLGKELRTPGQISGFLQDMQPTRWQRIRAGIISYFINNLISGPITHAGYSVGNTVWELFKASVDTTAAAAIGAVREAIAGKPVDRVYFGEVGAHLYGMVSGGRDGFPAAAAALRTGVPLMKGAAFKLIKDDLAAFEKDNGREPNVAELQWIYDNATANVGSTLPDDMYRPQAIPGKIGYVLETPSRSVAAIHTIHYSMNYEAEIAQRAFRTAMRDGLEPGSAAFNQSIAEFTARPPLDEMQAAHDEALKMVLMRKPAYGTAMYHLSKAVNSNILAKLVMPFMQVGTNILRGGLVEHTPLAFASTEMRGDLLGKRGDVARDTQVAKISAGIGLSAAVLGLTAQEILTDGGPSDQKERELKETTGWKPYSIRIGDYYVPYRKYLGPLGPLIAGVSDIYAVGHHLSEGGLTKAAASSVFGLAEVIADESWMRGLSQFIDAARHWDRDGGKYLRNLSMDFIPFSVGLSQISTLTDPVRREVRSELDALRSRIPGLSQDLHPMRDIWGEPIPRGTTLSPSRVVQDPATEALSRLEIYPARLERKIRGVELTDQQYDDFTRIAGRMAKLEIMSIVRQPGFAQAPRFAATELIHKALEGARERARSLIMMQNPGIPLAAKDNKIAKIRGEKVH